MNEYLPQATLLRLIGVLTLVLAAHVQRLPAWEIAFILALLGWRALTATRQWRMPPKSLRIALTLIAFVGVYLSFGRASGQTAGTALLCVMAALKLTELKARRDVMVIVFLMYFTLLTHFLFDQELWTIALLLVCAVAITALLIEVNHAGEPLPPRVTLRLGGSMVAQALPVMVVIFILFPRVPGPLWGLPSDAGAARSGLADSMSPGDISSLILSDEVAFRVRFFDPPPPPKQRYWRGPVFDYFDGRQWSRGHRPGISDTQLPYVELAGEPVRYEVVMEPHRQSWLFAIDLPERASLPADSTLNSDYQLLANQRVRERKLYTLSSYPEYTLQPRIPRWLANKTLALPLGFNPRTLAWAEQLRDEAGDDDAAVINRVLQHFRREPFRYTLEPPPLGEDSVDEFLFETRAGFCEHYASAFSVLMRAAGIPARVVLGYQGGEQNAVGDYYIVRQSDAHAWTELWLPQRGWVRVDPTAAVAPERVERGISSALSASSGLPAFLTRDGSNWVFQVRARWDWVNAQWNRWVLAYGPELQRDFLARFGIRDWTGMILVLTIAATSLLLVISLLLLRQYLPTQASDPALRLWLQALARLKPLGMQARPDEGPRDFVQRLSEQYPQTAAALRPVLEAYLRTRYLEDTPALETLRQHVRVFQVPASER